MRSFINLFHEKLDCAPQSLKLESLINSPPKGGVMHDDIREE